MPVTKKLSHKIILAQIQRIRSRNNKLWMKLMALALESKPRKAKAIVKKIVANDIRVTKWTSRI
jgi:hypothetical protein